MKDTKREKKKQRSFEADCQDKIDKNEFKPSLKRKKITSNDEEIIDKKV